MSRKTLVWFWASVAAATFLLGGGISSARQAFARAGTAKDSVLLALSIAGLAIALFVAGRIAIVSGRIKRAATMRQPAIRADERRTS